MEPKLGLKKDTEKNIGSELLSLLANTYALYLKTQSCHWNIVSPHFFHLHLLLEKQYTELSSAIDEIAERIRSLGFLVDARFSEFQKRTSIEDLKPSAKASDMILSLMRSHEEICKLTRGLIHQAQDALDDVTADLVIRRIAFHEKAAWMLRSSL